MLFSDNTTAAFLNDEFEPVWESVRPVPTLTIDFGNGHEIERTLHGNIASYVCDAAGKVIDILPGLYAPAEYRQRMAELARLHARLRSDPARAPGRLQADPPYPKRLADVVS